MMVAVLDGGDLFQRPAEVGLEEGGCAGKCLADGSRRGARSRLGAEVARGGPSRRTRHQSGGCRSFLASAGPRRAQPEAGSTAVAMSRGLAAEQRGTITQTRPGCPPAGARMMIVASCPP